MDSFIPNVMFRSRRRTGEILVCLIEWAYITWPGTLRVMLSDTALEFEWMRVPFPVNTKHLYNVYTMLDQRRRHWADVVQMFCVCWVPLNLSVAMVTEVVIILMCKTERQ